MYFYVDICSKGEIMFVFAEYVKSVLYCCFRWHFH